MQNTNKYRVDRSKSATVTPVGMASIQYIGNSLSAANRVFATTEHGYDNWEQVDKAYGVVLSVWDEKQSCYVVFDAKGFE